MTQDVLKDERVTAGCVRFRLEKPDHIGVIDTEGHIRKILIDFSDYQRLLEAIEDEGLILAMTEVKDEIPLNLNEALAELESV